uniref:Uncharacterized protein n=1 Tax=Pyxicephalus adspersus TaxID=30357 RepID=A0AAV3AWU3_PYXAD|nr:TPA: hypothetical protein GDO54_011397 [Pyxicephalus adspersus]
MLQGGFSALREKGLTIARYFITGRTQCTLADLLNLSLPYDLDLLKAAQLSHFIKMLQAEDGYDRQLMEKMFIDDMNSRHALSAIYFFLNMAPEGYTPTYLKGWETSFTQTQKHHVLRYWGTRSSHPGIRHHTNGTLFSPLNQIYAGDVEGTGTKLHIFWTCPRLAGLWQGSVKICQGLVLDNGYEGSGEDGRFL